MLIWPQSGARAVDDGVVNPQHDDSADDRHKHTVEVETGDPGSANQAEEDPSNDGTDDPKDNIEDQALAALVHYLGRDEAGNQSQNDPSDD